MRQGSDRIETWGHSMLIEGGCWIASKRVKTLLSLKSSWAYQRMFDNDANRVSSQAVERINLSALTSYGLPKKFT
jgi:hypothetical protein